MKYSLIIPIYNEIKTLKKLIKKLELLPKNIEKIIVDDGSDDGSEVLLKDYNKLKLVKNKKNYGKGYSIRQGLNIASYENIILIDGDLEIDIENIPNLISEYEIAPQNILIGTRWPSINDKRIKNADDFGNYIINKFFNFVYKTNFNDVLCCLKILKKKDISGLCLSSNGFSIESEIMAKLVTKNYSTKEVSIKYERRTVKQGKKLKMIHGWNILFTIISVKLTNKFH
tara:strand:- start:56 stop:739 length:684 start_codon:yes stop_codon:yes gene_type:complete